MDLCNSQIALNASQLKGNNSSLLENTPDERGSASPRNGEAIVRGDGRLSQSLVKSGTGQFTDGKYLFKNGSVEGLQSNSNLVNQASSMLNIIENSPNIASRI